MKKVYTLQEGEAYNLGDVQAHLTTELFFQTGMSGKGSLSFTVYWEEPGTEAEVDVAIASYDFSPEKVAKDNNARAAKAAQEEVMKELAANDVRVKYGLPDIMSDQDKAEYENSIQTLQGESDNPSSDEAYNPVLPPGVTPPPYASFTVTVTRVEGWQGNLGFKVELGSADPAFTPSSLALAVYTNPDCADYLYTTGAFVETEGVWGAVCPPGQEPGDVDINFGILYGAAPMSCWTMPQGQTIQTVTAYEETT